MDRFENRVIRFSNRSGQSSGWFSGRPPPHPMSSCLPPLLGHRIRLALRCVIPDITFLRIWAWSVRPGDPHFSQRAGVFVDR